MAKLGTHNNRARFHGIQYRHLLLFILTMLLVVIPSVFAHDPTSPRGGCPPVEEEIVDLRALSEMLADTRAIGLFTKLRIKKDISKMLQRLKKFHDGNSQYSLEQIEEQYDLLLMKIAIHLQDADLGLHRHLCNAWLTIWEDLRDFDRFHEYQP